MGSIKSFIFLITLSLLSGCILPTSVTVTTTSTTTDTSSTTIPPLSGPGPSPSPDVTATTPTVTSVSPSSGGAGNLITVTGTGFLTGSSATQIYLNAILCNNTQVINDTTIMCLTPTPIPAPAGGTTIAVDVVASNPGPLTSAALVGGYTYNPLLSVTAVAPANGQAGQTVTLTGTGFLSSATVTLGGVQCTTVTLNSDTSLGCLLPQNIPGTYDIRVVLPDLQSAVLPASFTYSHGAAQFWAGPKHVCGIDSTSTLKCWGANSSGQLGDGLIVDKSIPTSPTAVAQSQTAPGGNHTCSLNAAGNIYCWGLNSSGQLGIGSLTDSLTPALVPVSFGAFMSNQATALSAGSLHSCAVFELFSAAAPSFHTSVYCWGENSSGQLGTSDNTTYSSIPATPAIDATNAAAYPSVTVSAGGVHTCATVAGAVSCWGGNFSGQLGDGTTTAKTSATAIASLSSGVTQIAAGFDFTCALSSGQVSCWGSNNRGQLGNGTTTDSSSPGIVLYAGSLSPISGVTAIAAGNSHACALLSGGEVWCWGSNQLGQLGNGLTLDSSYPVQMQNLPYGATAIGAGLDYTCVISNGTLQCLGNNYYGTFGNNSFANSSTFRSTLSF